MSDKYREAGVDLEAGYESVRLIKSHVARTKTMGAIDSIGAFGGMFDLSRYVQGTCARQRHRRRRHQADDCI